DVGFAGDLGGGATPGAGRGDPDGFVLALSSKGERRWAVTFGDEQNQHVYSAATRPHGTLAVTGKFSGTIAVDGRRLQRSGRFDDAFLGTATKGRCDVSRAWDRCAAIPLDPNDRGGVDAKGFLTTE